MGSRERDDEDWMRSVGAAWWAMGNVAAMIAWAPALWATPLLVGALMSPKDDAKARGKGAKAAPASPAPEPAAPERTLPELAAPEPASNVVPMPKAPARKAAVAAQRKAPTRP